MADQYLSLVAAGEPARLDAWITWFSSWHWYTLVSLALIAAPLLVPTGRLPSRRWRWSAVPAYGVVGSVTLLAMLAETVVVESGTVLSNPTGIAGPAVEELRLWEVLGPLTSLSITGAALSVVGEFFSPLPIALLPLSAGAAILRYRLLDIDPVIKRTAVYSVVTALLAALYFAGVTATTVLVPAPDTHPVIVAMSTLAVVACFRPVRARVHAAIDRRVYRSRYDAARVVDGYRTRVRELVDLDAVSVELVGTVQRTVRPASTTLGLRSADSQVVPAMPDAHDPAFA